MSSSVWSPPLGDMLSSHREQELERLVQVLLSHRLQDKSNTPLCECPLCEKVRPSLYNSTQFLHRPVQLHITLYISRQPCTALQNSIQLYTALYISTKPCTTLHNSTQVQTILHNSSQQFYTALYNATPLYTTQKNLKKTKNSFKLSFEQNSPIMLGFFI